MIVFASLIRSADGTPLTATTDFNSEADATVQEGKRFVKLLSKQIFKYPKRVCFQTDDVAIQ